MWKHEAKIRTVNASYLVKSHNVDPTAKIDVFRVQAVDSFLLKSLLSKGIVGRQGGGQHWVHNECKDVQTVEKTLPEGALNIVLLDYLLKRFYHDSPPG